MKLDVRLTLFVSDSGISLDFFLIRVRFSSIISAILRGSLVLIIDLLLSDRLFSFDFGLFSFVFHRFFNLLYY